MKWYTFSINDIKQKLKTDESGLAKAERQNRLKQNGPNEMT